MAEMNQFGLDIAIDEETAQGKYSNLAIISHSPSVFIIDFAMVLPTWKRLMSGVVSYSLRSTPNDC